MQSAFEPTGAFAHDLHGSDEGLLHQFDALRIDEGLDGKVLTLGEGAKAINECLDMNAAVCIGMRGDAVVGSLELRECVALRQAP